MNDQSKDGSSKSIKRKKAGSKKFSGKQSPANVAKFHFAIEAENPQINVTIAPINLKLPAPPWPDWPKPQAGP